MDIKPIAEKYVTECLKKGADAAEVYVESGRRLSVRVRNGEIETVQEASSHGAGFRVFVKGAMAFASSNDLSEGTCREAIDRAVAFARITTPEPSNVLPDDKGVGDPGPLYDPEIAGIPMDRKVGLAMKAEELALKDPRITLSGGAGYGEGEGEIALANSHGLVKSYKSSSCSFAVSVVAAAGEERASGGESCGRRFFADLKPVEEVAESAARKAGEMLGAKPVKTQKAAVVFSPDVARALLGGILGAVNGERVLQKASFLAGRVGEKIGSGLITLIDDGLRPKGPASAPFDGEGVPQQTRVIVERGVLRGYMYNTIVAARAGVKSTGNASRGGFTSLPGIGPHNFYMAAGTAKPEDIIAATKRGLLVREVTGYGINPVSGHFSGGAAGFWIENGKIAHPVRGLTIAATAAAMLEGVDMVGDDLDLDRGLTAPTFRVAEMQIGGE
jgi:PmbA protein